MQVVTREAVLPSTMKASSCFRQICTHTRTPLRYLVSKHSKEHEVDPKCWLKDNNLWGTGLENLGQMLQPWVIPHSYPGGPLEVGAAHRHPLPQRNGCCVYCTWAWVWWCVMWTPRLELFEVWKLDLQLLEGILVKEKQFLKRVNLHSEEVLHSGLRTLVTSQCQLQVMFDKQTDLVRFLISWTFHHNLFSNCSLTVGLFILVSFLQWSEIKNSIMGHK